MSGIVKVENFDISKMYFEKAKEKPVPGQKHMSYTEIPIKYQYEKSKGKCMVCIDNVYSRGINRFPNDASLPATNYTLSLSIGQNDTEPTEYEEKVIAMFNEIKSRIVDLIKNDPDLKKKLKTSVILNTFEIFYFKIENDAPIEGHAPRIFPKMKPKFRTNYDEELQIDTRVFDEDGQLEPSDLNGKISTLKIALSLDHVFLSKDKIKLNMRVMEIFVKDSIPINQRFLTPPNSPVKQSKRPRCVFDELDDEDNEESNKVKRKLNFDGDDDE